MYRKPSPQLTIDDFILPFSGTLDSNNRWVQLANIIPWDEFEEEYAFMFPSDRGHVAKPVRMALGTLIIQARCGYTDRETVQQITENPYLQWFIGLKEFQLTRPITPAALVKFRKRFKKERMSQINERIALSEQAAKISKNQAQTDRKDDNDHDDQRGPRSPQAGKAESEITVEATSEKSTPNQGMLILDATCTPADIKYPTDLGLLNESREKLDEIIDTLHQAKDKVTKRPRTYRQKARKAYLSVSKQRNPRKNQLRKGIKQQLQYCKRNLRHVDRMLKELPTDSEVLSSRQVKLLETIQTVIEQQETMYKAKRHQIQNRIVNLYQDHVRPIVRGKASAKVEFGAKVAISIEKGFCRIEKLSWDAFNEAETLIESVERYKARNGCYPEAVLADRIYRNRENLAYCKKYNIRLSGPKLGRPSGNALKKVEKTLERMDAKLRNAVEGKFGEGKRKYGLDRIYAKLKETAECMISMQFLVMNLERKLRVLFVHFLKRYFTLNDIGLHV
ncbi:IS5 family transposase ISDha14 [bioreactor metagenome]|uniref:IS5 family transposase ISDha14 n=1 Tax=bioreactor metagenome TaxID=1076179 RepID=A0A645BMQ6_9ZZZZ